jgi:transposase-like protein
LSDDTALANYVSEPTPLKTQEEEFEWTLPKMTAVTMLLQGKKVKEIAVEIGVTEQTIYNWRKKTAFANALQVAREETRTRIQDKLLGAIDESVDKMVDLMRTGNNRQRVQLDAASNILKFAPQIFAKDEQGQAAEVKVVVVNQTTIQNRKEELRDWEKDMGYDVVDYREINNLTVEK